MIRLLRGWIVGDRSDEAFLRELGVTLLGEFESEVDSVDWDCEMLDETFAKLAPYWGRFLWGLDRFDA